MYCKQATSCIRQYSLDEPQNSQNLHRRSVWRISNWSTVELISFLQCIPVKENKFNIHVSFLLFRQFSSSVCHYKKEKYLPPSMFLQ